ncbi:MAG: FecR domain-containing protein [Prevotellaceae bacterium]|jgi:ferric-dicitrate binding protein FerR (iron transport regulator)|nr:FecR domain-containing protein [Prevotellaceae bacterium]
MEAIKAWAEASEENSRQLRRERKLFDAILLVDAVPQAADKGARAGRSRRSIFVRELGRMAAAVVVGVGISAAFLLTRGEHDEVKNVAMQTITVPAGQRANVVLADGTGVWLNAGTTLRYPTDFMETQREVQLDGEAYFDVVHNEHAPFVVHTHALDVQVLGTAFNVEAYTRKGDFEVSLMRGSVRVIDPANPRMSVTLQPDQKSTLRDGRLVVSRIDYHEVYRWKEGLYCFRNKSFGQIMEDMEKYYDIRIVLDKQRIKDVTLTGKFRISDGLDYALRVLRQEIPFSYRRDKEHDIIYIE